MPSTSFERGVLVVFDTEILKDGYFCWIFFVKVVFPTPDGDDRMSMIFFLPSCMNDLKSVS